MRFFPLTICLGICSLGLLLAQPPQDGKDKRPPMQHKNLKVLSEDEMRTGIMRKFAVAMGGNCQTCHVQGDNASDENPHKNIARAMITMTKEINAKFPDGKEHVTCF